MLVGEVLVDFVCDREGFKPYWYDDATEGRIAGPNAPAQGTPTIGHGLTKPDFAKVGKPVPQTITDRASRGIVRILLSSEYRNDYDAFLRRIGWDEVPEEARWALISFGYNLGRSWPNVAGFETMQAAHRAKDRKAVERAFILYRNRGSIWERGLRLRREAEARMWAAGWARRDPLSYLRPVELQRVKNLEALRATATKRGRWLVRERAAATVLKAKLRGTIGAIKAMTAKQRTEENRRERLALLRDAVAGRPLAL